MFEVIICFLLHCTISLVLIYCYDEEKIWHNNETAPSLRMPNLHNLGNECNISHQQRYVDKVIIPSHDYFSAVSDINTRQDNNDPMIQLMVWLPTFLLVTNAVRKTEKIPYLWLNIVIGLFICGLTTFIVFIIYNRTSLKLGTFELSISDIKNDFYYIQNHGGFEFDLSEEDALNNFIIQKHYYYIRTVRYTIEKRYRIKKVIEVIAGLIYILFIMRIPN